MTHCYYFVFLLLFVLISDVVANDQFTDDDEYYAGCPGCSMYERNEYSVTQLDLIKADILRKLRMKNPPNVTSSPLLQQLPESFLRNMMDLANDEILGYDYDDEEDTSISITAISEKANEIVGLNNVLQFQFNSNPLDIKNATLHFYISSTNSDSSATAAAATAAVVRGQAHCTNFTVSVNKVYTRADHQHRVIRYRRIKVPFITTGVQAHGLDNCRGQDRWVSLEVTSLLKRLRHQTSTTLLLQIVVDHNNNSQADHLFATPAYQVNQDSRPYIEVIMRGPNDTVSTQYQTTRKRKRRSASNSDCNEMTEREGRCCRQKLIINFAEFGWNWIVAPKKYDAYLCGGTCPSNCNQTLPASLITQQARLLRDNSICCSPSKFSPLPLVYIDDDGRVVYGMLPDMIVDECRCL